MHVRRSGDPIRALRQTVDNSLLGRLLGLGQMNKPVYREGRYYPEGTYPQQDIMALDPAGLPSTFDSFMSNFTPAGDIEAVAMAISDLKDGNYAQAALLPLMMVLPPAMGKRLRKHVDDLRRVKMSNAPDFEKQQQVVRIMGDMDELNKEALQFRSTNPQAYDQAMMEVAQSSESIADLAMERAASEDLAADVFVSGRQRELGYTGNAPDPRRAGLEYRSGDPLGGPPITTTDKRGMELVEGTPSERAVMSALLHQTHGSAGKTGLIPSAQMQRMAQDVPLVRTPLHNQQYRVIRDGEEILVKSGDIEEGDIIRSLSQKSTGTYKGDDRLVSFSGADLAENRKGFGIDINDKMTAKDMDAALEAADIGYYDVSFGDAPSPELSDADIGLLEDLYDPRRPSFKIINTKGMPVTRADVMKPASGSGSLRYPGEDEIGVSARQAFDVLQTGLEEEGVPFMLLSPNRRFKYDRGGKFKVLKK